MTKQEIFEAHKSRLTEELLHLHNLVVNADFENAFALVVNLKDYFSALSDEINQAQG